MSTIGKAYVQIMPSAKGIKGMLEKNMRGDVSSAGISLGGSLGSNLSKFAVKAFAAVGVAKLIGKSFTEGGKVQQSLGGIETLFKNSSDKMKKYASQAFKTAGLSANDYMENVTSFSASLLQSLGGDTSKAADIANMAMIDMSDNANKMGTSMESIQNAYQGFAKQNYTMLDNLKLGYGGTKSEMNRLLSDAQKLTGVKYDINNLSDVYSAVHAIQGKLEITGTTAKEAGSTLTGSFNAAKSAFTNLLGNLTTGNGDLKQNVRDMVSTIGDFITKGLFPMVKNLIKGLPDIVETLLFEEGPKILKNISIIAIDIGKWFAENFPKIIEQFGEFIKKGFDTLRENGPDILNGILEFLGYIWDGFSSALNNYIELFPDITEILTSLMTGFFAFVEENGPTLLDKGSELLGNFIDGILNTVPNLIDSIPGIIDGFIKAVVALLPSIVENGFNLLIKFISGIIKAIPNLIAAIPKIIFNIVKVLMDYDWLGLGVRLLKMLVNGILSLLGAVLSAGGKIAKNLLDNLIGLPGKLWNLAVNIFKRFAEGILNRVGYTKEQAGKIVSGLINVVSKLPGKLYDIGKNLIMGLWNGISSVGQWIKNKISGFCDGIVGGIKSFFGIKSPSRLMANEIGKYLPEGLAVGIEKNLKPVSNAMDEMGNLVTRDFESDINFKANTLNGLKGYSQDIQFNSDEKSRIDLVANLTLGSKTYKLLVDDISKEQDRQAELILAY